MTTTSVSLSDHTIAYDDFGTGDVTFVCIPGWCNPRRLLAPLGAHLGQRHRALVVDLPGHGGSSLPAKDFGTEDVITDLLAVLDHAKVDRFVPICVANAGWFALEIAKRFPNRVPALVSLTWSLCDLPAFFRMALEGLQSPSEWEEIRDMFFGMWFQHAEPDFIATVQDDMAKFDFDMWKRSGREVEASFAQHQSPVHFNNALPTPVPLLHLFCSPGLPQEFLDTHKAQVNPNAWYHEKIFDQPWAFPSFEAPDVLAAEIEPFVARVLGTT